MSSRSLREPGPSADAARISNLRTARKGVSEIFFGWPLPVGGPPARSAAGSWRAAREELPLEVGGPPERNFIFQWASRDHRDHRDLREMASQACAPGHWLNRRHWDNGHLARCVDCQWTAGGLSMDCQWTANGRKWAANATRKMRVVPVRLFPVRSASQAQSRRSRWSRRSR